MGPSTDISQGNIKARLRMIMLYNAASINSGIVIDTDNLSEHYLGFWTIHGDVGDFKPLGKLWKTEVYELAKYIKNDYNAKITKYIENLDDESQDENEYSRWLVAMTALDHAIEITPTDGNGVNDLGDMGQIAPGYTYTEVDKVLQAVVYNPNFTMPTLKDIADEYFNGDIDTVNKIVMRYLNSQFKRNKEYVGVRL
jgi:NH3-dependent NAD+ synthetase